MSNHLNENCEIPPVGDSSQPINKQLVVAPLYHVYDICLGDRFDRDSNDEGDDYDELAVKSLIDHAWSTRVLRLIGNKAKLMESFSWLSTVGGGYSALGERDSKFSARAGALSLGQQLHLADLLGDERLKIMCHLFAILAALQLNNKCLCYNYIRRVVMPLIKALPYKDQITTNIMRHIYFRMKFYHKFMSARNNAIEDQGSKNDLDAHDPLTEQ